MLYSKCLSTPPFHFYAHNKKKTVTPSKGKKVFYNRSTNSAAFCAIQLISFKPPSLSLYAQNKKKSVTPSRGKKVFYNRLTNSATLNAIQ